MPVQERYAIASRHSVMTPVKAVSTLDRRSRRVKGPTKTQWREIRPLRLALKKVSFVPLEDWGACNLVLHILDQQSHVPIEKGSPTLS